nr:MAG TPA: hypothetical protein [Caudoviricetes sp.]
MFSAVCSSFEILSLLPFISLVCDSTVDFSPLAVCSS